MFEIKRGNKASLKRIRAVGRKNGVTYVKCLFGGRLDFLLPVVGSINANTIVISSGRTKEYLFRIAHPMIKSIIFIDKDKVTGLEKWNEDSGMFFYSASSLENAVNLANSLTDRGDVVMYAPFRLGEEIPRNYFDFDRLAENAWL